ncbi:MAG: NAD(P)H-dependent glycerol-3-phosphate dehydrogenase [Candidatus Margulisiibacteriota bacterium]
MSKISVIGAGAWGTTLSILLAEKGHAVTLWMYEKDLAEAMQETRENKTFLPGFPIPGDIDITAKAEEANKAEIYFFAVPTQFLRTTVKKFNPGNSPVVCASKGIEINTLKLPLQIISEELKIKSPAILSGPNLSNEIARGMPAAAVIASEDAAKAKSLQEIISLEHFRIYTSADPLGVQLGGALKNVIAIAAGITDGLELGNNAKAALLIRGIAEISRLGAAMGADPKTFAGLSGMGDLITTCGSTLSRNHSVGEQLARGKKLAEILAGMKNVAEGVATAKAAISLGKKHNVELPVAKEVYRVLYEGKNPLESITALMNRTPTSE